MFSQEQKVEETFERVWELSPGDRERTLNDLCAGKDGLLEDVRSLLQSHVEAGAFLETPPVFTGLSEDEPLQASKFTGRRVGPYELRDEIGHGGMSSGRRQWKRESGYHRRSLAETLVFRFKTLFGDRVRTRRIENQFKELLLKCAILNQMTHLGMPENAKVTD
jgi:hypothetical protein